MVNQNRRVKDLTVEELQHVLKEKLSKEGKVVLRLNEIKEELKELQHQDQNRSDLVAWNKLQDAIDSVLNMDGEWMSSQGSCGWTNPSW